MTSRFRHAPARHVRRAPGAPLPWCAALSAVLAAAVASMGCSAASPTAVVELEQTSAGARLASLEWLAGRWVGASQRGTWESVYSTPAGGQILGFSKELVSGVVVFHEFERFEVRGGEVVLIPSPNGAVGVAFTLVGHDPAVPRAVFRNPGHDFPTEIAYEQVDDDLLRVGVFAEREGQRTGFELELHRAD